MSEVCPVCAGAEQLSARVIRNEKRDSWTRTTIFHEIANYCPRCGRKLHNRASDHKIECTD